MRDDETSLLTEEIYVIITGDELTTLAEAKHYPDWSEWHKSMQEKLEVLSKKGT
jgi:hypothetical protein